MSDYKFKEIHHNKIDTQDMIIKMMENPRPTGDARLKMVEFISDFLEYSEWFEREKDSPDGSWAWEFVGWLCDKVGWADDK